MIYMYSYVIHTQLSPASLLFAFAYYAIDTAVASRLQLLVVKLGPDNSALEPLAPLPVLSPLVQLNTGFTA